MTILVADKINGWFGSLDVASNYTAPLGNPAVEINSFPYAGPDYIYYAGMRFGPPAPYPVTASSNIYATGYSSAPYNPNTYDEDGTPILADPNLRFNFKGDGGGIKLYDALTDRRTSLTIKDAFFTDKLKPTGTTYPALASWAPENGAVSDLQTAINRGPITFLGSEKTDILKGEGGALKFDDFIYGYGGNDTLEGGGGHDVIDGAAGKDTLFGGIGNDKLKGGSEVDRLEGGEGNDTLDGGRDNDVMIGGRGNDRYRVDGRFDTVVELSAQGTDTVTSSLANFTLPGAVENLILTGGGTRFFFTNGTGNALNNTLTGDEGNNILRGEAGNDVLDGGGSGDALFGGAGSDVFLFRNIPGHIESDRIEDFKGRGTSDGDKIVFQGFAAGTQIEHINDQVYGLYLGDEVQYFIQIFGTFNTGDAIFMP